MDSDDLLTVGAVAQRAGVATSALRFYEERGLITSERTSANHRRFKRSVLRRVAVIKAAQNVGLTLEQIGQALAGLPDGRTPTAKDWTALSAGWRNQLNDQIAFLERLRDDLDGCIGCGCLSIDRCALVNAGDKAALRGSGAQYLMPPGSTTS